MCTSVDAQNELKAAGINYLKYLYALELSAGANFKRAKRDLAGSARFVDVADDLDRAIQDEADHARMIMRILLHLGEAENDPRELAQMTRDVINRLDHGIEGLWPAHLDPWARICFNHKLESRFAKQGVNELWQNLHAIAMVCQDSHLNFLAWDLCYRVRNDETFHVRLDAEILKIYEERYPQEDMMERIAKAPVGRGPFREAIRAKHRLNLAVARSRPKGDPASS